MFPISLSWTCWSRETTISCRAGPPTAPLLLNNYGLLSVFVSHSCAPLVYRSDFNAGFLLSAAKPYRKVGMWQWEGKNSTWILKRWSSFNICTCLCCCNSLLAAYWWTLVQGIVFLVENELLRHTPEDIAQFLYKGEGLNKTAIGDYLGERCVFSKFALRLLFYPHSVLDIFYPSSPSFCSTGMTSTSKFSRPLSTSTSSPIWTSSRLSGKLLSFLVWTTEKLFLSFVLVILW